MDTVTEATAVEAEDVTTEDPKVDTIRIPHTLARLERYWMKNPELRLGQILGNIASEEGVDSYFVEDATVARKLEEKVPSWN
jgi:hypothetical protein